MADQSRRIKVPAGCRIWMRQQRGVSRRHIYVIWDPRSGSNMNRAYVYRYRPSYRPAYRTDTWRAWTSLDNILRLTQRGLWIEIGGALWVEEGL